MNCLCLALALAALSAVPSAPAGAQSASLIERFRTPSAADRPRTWFHVMSGNFSDDGITTDLEAIRAAGIGGVLMFNVTQFTPRGQVTFGSDAHYERIRHLAGEAERLGLSFGVHNSDGWTASGGPWITPPMSMKEVVWTTTTTEGGRVAMTLPPLPSRMGYAEDIALLAYPALPGELADRPFVVSSNWDGFDSTPLHTPQLDDVSILPQAAGAYIQFAYEDLVRLQGLTIVHDGSQRRMGSWRADIVLERSVDGVTFEEVGALPRRRMGYGRAGFEARFDGLAGKAFRLRSSGDLALSQLAPTTVELVPDRLARTSLHHQDVMTLASLAPYAGPDLIAPQDIIDLTDALDDDGQLTATLPEGTWTLMRLGFTTTGAANLPASDEGRGLEVDKFARAPLQAHYDSYIGKIADSVRDIAPSAHQYTQIDSYEVGGQNWTSGYDAIYERRHHQSLTAFLPVFAGRYVDGADETARVLRRMRALNSDLFQENYIGYFRELANADGLALYVEPYGFGPFSEVDIGGEADLPMGEFWLDDGSKKVAAAVSAANIHGLPVASAEAFTARPVINWRFHPAMAKSTGDRMWAFGVNEFMFHRYAHQSNTMVRPGMVMGFWGSHIDRTQIWWPAAMKAWTDYLARGQVLLREGREVVPLAVFLTEDSPAICPERDELHDFWARGYSFDCLTTDILLNASSTADGELTFDSGMSYRALHITDPRCLSVDVLRRLDHIAAGGVPIISDRPASCASAEGDRVDRGDLVARVWSRPNVRKTDEWEEAFSDFGIHPSVTLAGGGAIVSTHRTSADRDIFFLFNDSDEYVSTRVSLAASNGSPALWDPHSGEVLHIAAYDQMNGRTELALEFGPQDSLFVVFEHASYPHGMAPVLDEQTDQTAFYAMNGVVWQDRAIDPPVAIDGPWTVRFSGEYGFDAEEAIARLRDWRDSDDPNNRYYSGLISYRTTFGLEASHVHAADRFLLDLGLVEVAASVQVNGEEVGVHWHEGQVFDVTDFVSTGENTLDVTVATSWVNRLIGDAALPDVDGYDPGGQIVQTDMPDWFVENRAPPAGERLTFSTYDFYGPNDELSPSGLIGPVRLMRRTRFCQTGQGVGWEPCDG